MAPVVVVDFMGFKSGSMVFKNGSMGLKRDLMGFDNDSMGYILYGYTCDMI